MNAYELRALNDADLALEEQLLTRKVRALKLATSAIGAALLQQYRERLDAVRAEIERRSCE
jgi:hypothetical protein